jgi:hypothetical protein
MSNGHHFFHTCSCVAKSIQVFYYSHYFRKYDSAIDTSCAFEPNDLNLTTANFDSYGNVSFDPCEFTLHTAANAENNDKQKGTEIVTDLLTTFDFINDNQRSFA